MTRQKYDTVLFVQRFLRCKLSARSHFFLEWVTKNKQKHRAKAMKIFITCTLWNRCIKTEKFHRIGAKIRSKSHKSAKKSL